MAGGLLPSLVLSAQPASAINVQKRLHQMAWPFGPRRAAQTKGRLVGGLFSFSSRRTMSPIGQILFQTVSDAAGSGGNRLRSLGRGDAGLAGRHRSKFGVRARLQEGAGAVSHDQQAAGQQHDILQHESPAS
jgi:hypothetical protein